MSGKYILSYNNGWYGYYATRDDARDAQYNIKKYGDSTGVKQSTKIRYIMEDVEPSGKVNFVDIPEPNV